MSSTKIICQETLIIDAPSNKVREFIKTPERILDYYPGAKEGGVLEAGRYFYCQGGSGISLLEIITDKPQQVYLKVWTAMSCPKPFSVESIKANAFFIMEEDWKLEAQGNKTQLSKSWLNLEKIKLRFLPMAWIIRRSVKKESQLMAQKWAAVTKQ